MQDLTLFETEHFTVGQASGYRVPGYVIVESKTGCTRLADFAAGARSDLIACLVAAEALVQAVLEPERIYVAKFAELNPTVHFHVFPRTRRIGDAYAAAVADEPPYNGAKLMDWVWAQHASLDFSDAEILDFVARARALHAETRA